MYPFFWNVNFLNIFNFVTFSCDVPRNTNSNTKTQRPTFGVFFHFFWIEDVRMFVCRAGLKSSVLCSGLESLLLPRRRGCVDWGITSGDDGLCSLVQVAVTFWPHFVQCTIKAVVCVGVWYCNVWASALIKHLCLGCLRLYCTAFLLNLLYSFYYPVLFNNDALKWKFLFETINLRHTSWV